MTKSKRRGWQFWLKAFLLIACLTGGPFGWFLLGCYGGWKLVQDQPAPLHVEPNPHDDVVAAALFGYWVGNHK